ncbi:hypothetical protein crov401 [Cafeteria roenbergensis virus]|uniref:Uncharacterized protein n=1 Tax=Cafeteria roenbergensis virus (strain BV-PW1) TaxID=693272 RepID=E3T5H2_CROVB|nr:hypothetical protein crov401 [Cafeteria roenbergensis virus BV-PW1]ADO67435.1 hypothetical protein crov401 [Cafeteria roenbergensis virus BV-PW1]
MINYYQIIIIILIFLILYKTIKKEKMTNTNLIEHSISPQVLDLSIIENKNKKDLENLSKEEQKFFYSYGNNQTKLQMLTNFITHKYII